MAIALKENRAIRGVEATAQRPDGTLFPFLPFPTPIRNTEGELVGAVNMLVDITDQKNAEAQQKILLDELNHRVKNNMQMLQALLRVSQRDTESNDARVVLADASQRVAAMAAAQQVLYSSANPSSFSAEDFLHSVCRSAEQAFGPGITLKVEKSSGRLSNDISMPLALILNELLTNAAKHGLDESGQCSVSVGLASDGKEMILSVKDSGPGFEFRAPTRRSSGLGLVSGLARQLNGSLEIRRAAGAHCIVRFPNAR
jgi:two-component sensor histidine kinase